MQCEKLNVKDVDRIIASKKDTKIYSSYIKLKESGYDFIHIKDRRYPERLRNIYDYPIALYFKGKNFDNGKPSVAIVGARNCSEYGRRVAYSLSYEFSKMGISVISGMAAGIDAAGHKGCIDGGGDTYAVLGCGADICYPRGNIELYMRIPENGAVISEYAMNTPPRAGQFPMRNRIISALSDVIIVVEARKKSGSLITVDQALEQNREVMVVPGRIGDSLSEGCNNLIKMGAQVITCADDILDNSIIQNILKNKKPENAGEMGTNPGENTGYCKKNSGFGLASEKKLLYSCFNLYPKSLEQASIESGLDIVAANKTALELQLDGLIKEVSKNCYIVNDI